MMAKLTFWRNTPHTVMFIDDKPVTQRIEAENLELSICRPWTQTTPSRPSHRITFHAGWPSRNVYALEIEMDKSELLQLKKDIEQVLGTLSESVVEDRATLVLAEEGE